MDSEAAVGGKGLFATLDEYSRPTRVFLWKHRGKVAVASAVIAVGATVIFLRSRPPLSAAQQLLDNVESDEEEDEWSIPRLNSRRHRQRLSSINAGPGGKSLERSRMLLRVRKQFDTAATHFLPTLKLKIADYVDVANTIQQIRELRAGHSNAISTEDRAEAESRLWEDIKVTSFTYLFVTSYMQIAVCLVLRIQLHVLARSAKGLSDAGTAGAAAGAASVSTGPTRNGAANATSANSSSSSSSSARLNPISSDLDEADLALLDSDMFKVLIPGTYKQLFGEGIKALTQTVRRRIEADMTTWTVKKSVDYGDLAQLITGLRRAFEQDMRGLVSMILLPPEAFTSPEQTSTSASNMTADHTAQSLLSQTWDVVDSDRFEIVFSEATDTCFRQVLEALRRNIYTSDPLNSAAAAQRRTSPPLASVLPQIKAIANKLLPGISDPLPLEAKEVASGAALDALCVALFDSTEPSKASVRREDWSF